MEWLGQELLSLTGTGDSQLVFFGQIVHTENSNDILEGSVVLEQLLHTTSSVVVNLANNGWVEHTRRGVQWVHSWVDTELSKGTVQHSVGIKMGEGGGWSWISKIISWHVDGLDRGDGSGLGRGNSLLEGTQICGEGWLVSDSGWDTSEEGRHFGASLGEAEDVVDEEEHILVLLISEVLSDGETSEADTSSGTGWLVHLSVDEGGL